MVILIDKKLFNKFFEDKNKTKKYVLEIFTRVFSENGTIMAKNEIDLEKVKQNKLGSGLNFSSSTEFKVYGQKNEKQLLKKRTFLSDFSHCSRCCNCNRNFGVGRP